MKSVAETVTKQAGALRSAVLMALAGAATLVAAPVASAGPTVGIGYDAFSAPVVDTLTGDTVTWNNDSSRQHTVTANDGSFDSGHLAVGDTYSRAFPSPGTFAYHCTLHPFMTGEVDVYDLLLDAPPGPAGPNRAYPVRGRAALPSGTPVAIQADSGDGFTTIGSTTVGSDGSFAASVVPTTTTALRAVARTSVSPPVQLIVVDHAVTISVRRLRGHRVLVDATVTPAAPGSTVVLQLRLRERFGWWPSRTLHLDAASHARFVVRRRATVPVRVALTLPDGASVLATSPVKRRY